MKSITKLKQRIQENITKTKAELVKLKESYNEAHVPKSGSITVAGITLGFDAEKMAESIDITGTAIGTFFSSSKASAKKAVQKYRDERAKLKANDALVEELNKEEEACSES